MVLLVQLMESPFFFNLRTTNRVGYLVYVTPLNILEVPGLLFSVQSPTYTPGQINDLLNGFLEEFGQIVEYMDAGNFEQVKQGLINRILARDKKLTDRTNRYWREIDLKRFEFDSRERLTGLIDSLTKEDIQKYFVLITAEQSRKLVVQSPGRGKQGESQKIDGKLYMVTHNATDFRKSAKSFFPAY